jgi:hypothetical protein
MTAGYPEFSATTGAKRTAAAQAELGALGLTITKIHFETADSPPKFFVKFPDGVPQWKIRKEIEAKLYDVGQKIGDKDLSFYVTKRTAPSKGWAD